MQGSARKDVVFGAARVYTATVPGPKWKSWLRRLPINCLKIDQSFLFGVPDDRDAATVIETIIQLAHKLGLTVVAECVSTRAQLAFLRDHDCDAIQGNFLCEALPPEAFVKAQVRTLRVPR